MSDVPDDFYIGYETPVPRRARRLLRSVVLGLIVLGGACAAIISASQRPFAASWFAFGERRTFGGRLTVAPYPTLEVWREGDTGGQSPVSRYLLVAFGKHGATPLVEAWAERHISVTGSLIGRNTRAMIEIEPDSIRRIDPAPGRTPLPASTQELNLGLMTLRGEIVDSKCYLGVMNPGEGATHRDCAERCISGGMPPLLVARIDDGRTRLFTLVSSRGEAVNASLHGKIAVPVELTGTVTQRGDELIIHADPPSYRVLR